MGKSGILFSDSDMGGVLKRMSHSTPALPHFFVRPNTQPEITATTFHVPRDENTPPKTLLCAQYKNHTPTTPPQPNNPPLPQRPHPSPPQHDNILLPHTTPTCVPRRLLWDMAADQSDLSFFSYVHDRATLVVTGRRVLCDFPPFPPISRGQDRTFSPGSYRSDPPHSKSAKRCPQSRTKTLDYTAFRKRHLPILPLSSHRPPRFSAVIVFAPLVEHFFRQLTYLLFLFRVQYSVPHCFV